MMVQMLIRQRHPFHRGQRPEKEVRMLRTRPRPTGCKAINEFAQPRPSSRNALEFGPSRNGARSNCDIILDLTGGTAFFPASDLRDGYLRVDPGHPAVTLQAVLKARDLAPQNTEYAQSYAETFYEVPKPDWQAALDAWQFCLGQPLDEVSRQRVYSQLARVYLRMARYDEARTWLAKINAGEILPLRRVLERKLPEPSAR